MAREITVSPTQLRILSKNKMLGRQTQIRVGTSEKKRWNNRTLKILHWK